MNETFKTEDPSNRNSFKVSCSSSLLDVQLLQLGKHETLYHINFLSHVVNL